MARIIPTCAPCAGLTASLGFKRPIEKDLLAENFDFCLQRLGKDKIGAWVLNEPEDIAAWLARPIRQITTDRPDIALSLR